jgi:hypothetical protein
MSAGAAAGAAGGAAAAAVMAQAMRAMGAIVRVAPHDFRAILERQLAPLVVHAVGGWFGTNYQYLTSYKGLAFFAKSPEPLDLPPSAEVVLAKSIWVPG